MEKRASGLHQPVGDSRAMAADLRLRRPTVPMAAD
jgi:hypothetical protein